MIREAKAMKKNNTIKEICEKLMSAGSILIFPHVSMDGDALGSSVALCRAMRGRGKMAYVLIEDKIPDYLRFLDDGSCTHDRDAIGSPDVCVCVDCAEIDRFILRKDKFLEGKASMCIDHHKTSSCFADFNYIDAAAATTAELVYDILTGMESPIDELTGEAIYAAILTDTGNFQYTNTNIKSHLIAIELYKSGIDRNYVNRMLYQNNRAEKFLIAGRIYNTIKMIAGGRAVTAYVTREMLKEAGAMIEDSEGIAETLRTISGVEISVFAKETAAGEVKFSMRSKSWADVSELSAKYDGGGHKGAAGCTLRATIGEALKIMEADIEEYFAKNGGGDDD